MRTGISVDTYPPVSEAQAFYAALDAVPPTMVTACSGWTVHEIAAHLAAGTAERSRIFEAVLAGEPVPETRPFAEREPAFRTLPDTELRARMVRERCQRARSALNAATVIRFTGWAMTPAMLVTHSRSELALYRWDLVGSDDLSRALLAQPALTAPSVQALKALDRLQEWPTARARQAGWGADPRSYVLRAPGQSDVVLHWHDGRTSLDMSAGRDLPGLETDADARLLLLWGRRPPSRACAEPQAHRRCTHDNWPPEAFKGFLALAAAGGLCGALETMLADKALHTGVRRHRRHGKGQ